MIAPKIKKLLKVVDKLQKKYFLAGLFVFFALTAAFICFYQLGASYLENWDEGLYAQVTKEMLQTKDLLVLHWNGEIYLDKTPFNYWFNAFFSLLFGLSEFSVRLMSAISGFLVIIIVSVYSYKNWGTLAAFFAFIAIALNNLFIWRARTGNLDALLSLLVVLSFLLMTSKNRYRYILLGVVFGCMFLQKATVVVFPFAIFCLTEVLFNYRNFFKNLIQYILLGIIMGMIIGTWLSLAQEASGNPSFSAYYLFSSDQGVSHLDLSKIKLDYISFAYYSLQRRFFFLFVIGLVFLLTRFYKRTEATIVLFATFLLATLSFTTRNNNWYLIPSMPFWALIVGYAAHRLVAFFARFIDKRILVTIIVIPSIYIAYKTFTVNIMSIINQQANVTEVQSAQIIRKLSKEKDIIMRLDHAYPVTLYYSDRKTYFYDHVDADLYKIIKQRGVNWVVGKSVIVGEFLKNPDIKPQKTIKNGDETVVSL